MSRPPKRNQTVESNNTRNTRFTVSVANTLCVPIVALANLINQFNESNNSLLSPSEYSELIDALILFGRCSLAFANRHRNFNQQARQDAE